MAKKLRYKKSVKFMSIVILIFASVITIFNCLIKFGKLNIYDVGNMPIAIDAAVCFILLGASLYLAASSRKGKLLASKIIACIIFIIGLHAFLEEFDSLSLRILLGMSMQTALCFVAFSIAIFFIRHKKAEKIVQWLLHCITFVAFAALIGHLLDVPWFYNMYAPTAMAVYTAGAFVVISSVATLINPKYGITGIFTGRLIGHLMARRMFFAMLTGIVAIAYLRYIGYKYQIVSWEMGLAIMTLAFCAMTLLLIWGVSSILNRAYTKLRKTQETLKHLVDAAPYSIIVADGKGYIIQANRKTEHLYGYDAKELAGRPLRELVPFELHDGDDSQKLVDFFEANVINSYGGDLDLTVKRKNGTEFPVEMHFIPIKTEKGKLLLAYIIDLSLTKQSQQIITSQLIELQSKNQELEQFNYISSHDLQEPLRTVLNYLDLIEEDYPDINPEVQMHLGAVKNTMTRMSRIVKSLLDFGRLGRDKKMALTDVGQLINNVTEDLQNLISEAGANITVYGAMPKLYAYETELRQLFQNLISNAIKFRKPGMAPVIEIGFKKTKGNYQFYVSDNGIGIDPKHFDKVFNIFQRLNREEDYEGHGIGLANCKKIAEMHGGKIWVESEPGKGTTFAFTILNFTS